MVTVLGPRHIPTSLLNEVQIVAADLLSEYWLRIGTCYLDYGARMDEDGQSTLVF